MADITLKNKTMEIGVNFHGAELKSMKKLSTGMEYLWCADPAYWGRTAPVLFPFVGSLKNKTYRYEGKEYGIGQHGFGRDRDFKLLRQTEDTLWFGLSDDEETLEKFPFHFQLEIGYQLLENGVKVLWKVKNTDDKELYFSIGAHPAFNCPLGDGKPTECSIRFQNKDGENIKEFSRTVLGQAGLVTDRYETVELQDGDLKITEHLFDIDTFIIEDNQVQKVSLINPEGEVYLTVTFDAPIVGVWSPVGKNAPFVCIEPWYGRCDCENFDGELKDREWGNTLAPGACFEVSYEITV